VGPYTLLMKVIVGHKIRFQ